jgi:RNA polymerase sigma-70 factor (ECF subfamily)
VRKPFWDLCRVRARKTYVGELALIGAGSVRSGSEKIPTITTADRQGAERRAERARVRAAQSGSVEAMESLYRCHWRPAYRAAYLIVRDQAAAEDIAQEAFLSALRSLDRFDRRRPFAPWLHRIVVNRAIDWSRARALRREVGEADSPTEPQENPGVHDVADALGLLSAEHRAVVVLRYLLGYTPGEIAKVLDLPRGTVNSRLRRALDQLGDTLREDER